MEVRVKAYPGFPCAAARTIIRAFLWTRGLRAVDIHGTMFGQENEEFDWLDNEIHIVAAERFRVTWINGEKHTISVQARTTADERIKNVRFHIHWVVQQIRLGRVTATTRLTANGTVAVGETIMISGRRTISAYGHDGDVTQSAVQDFFANNVPTDGAVLRTVAGFLYAVTSLEVEREETSNHAAER